MENVVKISLEKKKEEIKKAIRENLVAFLDGEFERKEGIINALKRYEGVIKALQKEKEVL